MLEFDASPFQQVAEDAWQISLGEVVLVVRGKDLTVQPAHGTVFFEERAAVNLTHPTMKPVPLVRRMLVNSAKRGDAILDPFGGSGSTLIACEQLGMRAHLLEIDPRYVDVIVRRWEHLTGKSATLDGRTFDSIAAERARRDA